MRKPVGNRGMRIHGLLSCFRVCHAHHLGCPLPFFANYSTNIPQTHISLRPLHMLLPLTNALFSQGNSFSPFKTQLKCRSRNPSLISPPHPKLSFPPLCQPLTCCASFWACTYYYIVLTLSPPGCPFLKVLSCTVPHMATYI